MLVLPEHDMTLVQASLRDLIWEYVETTAVACCNLNSRSTSIGLHGHAHVPMTYRKRTFGSGVFGSGVATDPPVVDLPISLNLETQTPVEFLLQDQETPTAPGNLPRDGLPRCDPSLEAVLLGPACVLVGVSRPPMRVSLTVGSTPRKLLCSSDRRWEIPRVRRRPGDPDPFTMLPPA
jgi:hypothetical protein